MDRDNNIKPMTHFQGREVEIDIPLDNGKYRYLFFKDGGQIALRDGEEWRDMAGDNLIFFMAHQIQEMRDELALLKSNGALMLSQERSATLIHVTDELGDTDGAYVHVMADPDDAGFRVDVSIYTEKSAQPSSFHSKAVVKSDYLPEKAPEKQGAELVPAQVGNYLVLNGGDTRIIVGDIAVAMTRSDEGVQVDLYRGDERVETLSLYFSDLESGPTASM